HPRPHVPRPRQVAEEILVLSLLPAHDRREHAVRRSVGEVEHARDDLLAGLGRDRPVAPRAVPLADPREQDTEVIVDLGHRPDRAPGIAPPRLLLDRDRRAQALDLVDLGLGHLAQKLAGVARETLDVPSLTFGVKRVEGERALARARDAGEADEGAA